MKKILLSALAIFFFANAQTAIAQTSTKFVVDQSMVHFFSSTPLEDIEANNTATKAVVVEETGEFTFRVPIKSFIFDKSLMQEHFNENYMESEKYPNGTFKGTIEGDFSLSEDGVYALEAVGTLNIHGVEVERRIPATITVEGDKVSLQSNFNVPLEAHNIKVPKVVFYNIAESIDVDIKADLKPFIRD